MKLPVRILIILACAGLIVCMPFFLSSPMLDGQVKMQLMNDGDAADDDDGEEIDFGRLFFSIAFAEEDDLIVETWTEGELHIESGWELPLDFSVPPAPKPENYTEDGYEDQSIRVKVETRETDGMIVDIAWVQIANPTQLRTATAYSLQSDRTLPLEKIARDNNAVIAMNGDLYSQLPEKKLFEYRMTQKIRSKTNKTKDTLIIDENGDFHLFVRSQGLPEYAKKVKANGGTVVNAFMFGPALVIDGELQPQDADYGYERQYKNPRSAIGQTGPLSYVMVVVEGRGESAGATHEELAKIMYDLGCIQAYNLDGGNTAEIFMADLTDETGKGIKFHFKGDRTTTKDRGQKDIIFFATAVP